MSRHWRSEAELTAELSIEFPIELFIELAIELHEVRTRSNQSARVVRSHREAFFTVLHQME